MSQFSGKHGRGAMKVRKELKRKQAEERDLHTLPSNRRVVKLILDLLAKGGTPS